MSGQQRQRGIVRRIAAEDLTGKEGYLAVLTDDEGAARVRLPADNAERPHYRIENGNEAGAYVDLEPLNPETLTSVKMKGVGSPGELLVLADTGTAADKGKLRANPDPGVTSGYYLAVAEEPFVDGQLALVRPLLAQVPADLDAALAAIGELETAVGDYQGEADLATDLATVEAAVDELPVKTELRQVVADGIHVWGGGAATTDAIPVTGLLDTDTVLCTLAARDATETLVMAAADEANEEIDVTLGANGADGVTKIAYLVLRAFAPAE